LVTCPDWLRDGSACSSLPPGFVWSQRACASRSSLIFRALYLDQQEQHFLGFACFVTAAKFVLSFLYIPPPSSPSLSFLSLFLTCILHCPPLPFHLPLFILSFLPYYSLRFLLPYAPSPYSTLNNLLLLPFLLIPAHSTLSPINPPSIPSLLLHRLISFSLSYSSPSLLFPF